MGRRFLTLCILVTLMIASVAFVIKPANAISPGQTEVYNVSANTNCGVVTATATLSYYTIGYDQYVRVDLGWASIQWYFGVTGVQFQIGREFTIIETNCPSVEHHVSVPWHIGLLWDWLGIPTWGEGSRVADHTEFPINCDVDYYFIAKRVNYQSSECWTELNVYIFNGPPKDADEDFKSLSLPPRSGGGGGCPILSVWDGSDYFEEGLLDIHNPEGVDVVYSHTLAAMPERVDDAYLFRLVEHPQTISHIDQVKLYAILEDGNTVKLPLIQAWHSEDGNVLPMLLRSDDWKVDTAGADHNNGISQSIDLKFAALNPNMNIVGFIFRIEGNNRILKY